MKRYNEQDLEKAFIKGGLMGVLTTFIMLGIFAFITMIEMM